ncbi:MAG: potassium-transporting ATPase subunit KdpC [Marmoricola sp.]
MSNNISLRLGQLGASIRAMLVLTVVCGIAYPLLVMGIGQVAFHSQANGSLIYRNGKLVGSSLIGQSFAGKAQYFQSRPSAAGTGDGYNPLSSSASNLALDNPVLLKNIEQNQAAIAKADGVPISAIPPDAVTASGSGLDPQISPAYAAIQVNRVAQARHVPVSVVKGLVSKYTEGRTLGFLGEPRVNVLELNLALDAYRP